MALTGWSTSNYLRVLLPGDGMEVFRAYPILISAWVNTPTIADMAVVHAMNSEGDSRAALALSAITGFGKARVTSESVGEAFSTAGITTNTWYHITGELISTTSRAALMNGSNRGTDPAAVNPAIPDQLYVGIYGDNSLPWDNAGGLAEVSIWDCAGMTTGNMDSLAAKLFNGGAAGAGGNPLIINAESAQPWTGKLAGYWIDGSNIIEDLAANGHPLSMVGTLTNFGSHPNVEAAKVNKNIAPGSMIPEA